MEMRWRPGSKLGDVNPRSQGGRSGGWVGAVEFEQAHTEAEEMLCIYYFSGSKSEGREKALVFLSCHEGSLAGDRF
jgi:hypothetical protein